MTPPTIIYGTAGLNPAYGISTAAGATELLETVRTLGIKDINTAQGYGPSEKLLGEANAAVKFNISTKHPGGAYPSPSTKEVVTKSCNDSLQALNTKQVRCHPYPYIHRLTTRSTHTCSTHQTSAAPLKRLCPVSTPSTRPKLFNASEYPITRPHKSRT